MSPEQLDPELLDDLRAVKPRPDHAFRARMDEQLAGGFARERRSRLRLPALRLRLLAPALGTLGAALVAVVLVLGGGGGTSGDDATLSMPAREAAGEQAATEQPAPDMDAGDSAGSATPGSARSAAPAPSAPQVTEQAGRRVERSARLELGAPEGRFQAVTDAVVRTTQRHDGFVASSQIARGADSGTGTFVLRIPAARLDAAMADLSRLASVRAIEGSTQDLTGQYDTASRALDDARTQRRAIVADLATATGASADRLRARLRTATARVERLERRQAELRRRTSYATVDLTVVAADGAAVVPGDDPWTPGDAWRDARRGLEVVAGVLIVALTIALPLGLLAALGAWGGRVLRRRRRDAALDSA
jgi:hypothetical protein